MEKLQLFAIILYRSIVIGGIILLLDNKAIWALPFAVLIGLCSEAEKLTKK